MVLPEFGTSHGFSTLHIAATERTSLAVVCIATSAMHPFATAALRIVDAYMVVFDCLLIPAGAVGDRCDRKQTPLAGLAVLAVGSGRPQC
jgi:hypothetical protein